MSSLIDEKVREMAKLVAENKETLVAKFILDNPEIKADEIELVQVNERFGFRFYVQRKE